MNGWTAGYVSDVSYTTGYYHELNPARAGIALLNAGLALPKIETGCELGFGQGLSLGIHAAASCCQWWGTDFNPTQAGFAQKLATESGTDTRLFDESFESFCARPDLPEFDFIGLHGIWSWISEDNRRVITDFLQRKLKVGGVLYISYNAQPGRAAMMPMRDLLKHYYEVMTPSSTGTLGRIDLAMNFADKLRTSNPAFLSSNPGVGARLDKMKGQPRNYLAHEYFNLDWHPMLFSKVAECLGSAKLSYACSANYFEHVDSLNLTTEQQALLQEIGDPIFREEVRDFMVNQHFRRDYWIKGPQQLGSREKQLALGGQKVILVQPRSSVSLDLECVLGRASMPERTYFPVLDALASHHPLSLDEIASSVKDKGISFSTVTQAVLVLLGAGVLQTVQANENQGDASISLRTKNLNKFLCERARYHADISNLASPVTGGGIEANRFEHLFLLALANGNVEPGDCAAYAWGILAAAGEKLIREGKVLESDKANLEELDKQAAAFFTQKLPIMRALGIA